MNLPFVALFYTISKCQFLLFQRIWLHFHAVNMMVGKRRNMKWTLHENEVGEESSEEGAE